MPFIGDSRLKSLYVTKIIRQRTKIELDAMLIKQIPLQ